MGNLASKLTTGSTYISLDKLLQRLNFVLWYIRLSIPYRISLWGLYLFLRKIYVIIRSFWWLLNGVTYTRWTNLDEKNYGQSAHVQNIIWRYKIDPVLEASDEYNFVTTHNSFQHPEYVLRDNVTLYYITGTEAFFVETDPEVDVTRSDTSCFMRIAQFDHAKRLISLPIASFHKLGRFLGRPKAKIIFVNNTTRCGSTLLVQMFEKTGKCRSMSEPDALNAISYLSRRLPKTTVLQLLETVVRVLCKPYNGRRYESYLMKTTAPGIYATPLMEEQFPDASMLFVYRNGINVGDSLSRASIQMPLLRAGYLFCTYAAYFITLQAKFADYFVNFPDHPLRQTPSMYACYIFTWSQIVYRYLNFREMGYRIDGVKYEHLVGNPRENMEIILTHCGLPVEWAEPAMAALASDSQRNSPLSMKNLSELQSFSDTFNFDLHKAQVDLMCEWSGISYDAPNDYVAEGTMTVAGTNNSMQTNGHSVHEKASNV